MRRIASPDLATVEREVRERLIAPRTLTGQVLAYLESEFDGSSEPSSSGLLAWIERSVPALEAYECDLLFSPLFTPSFEDRTALECALGEGSLDSEEVEALIDRLANERLEFVLRHEGEEARIEVARVLIERFVRLLRLDSPLPSELLAVEPFSMGIAPEARCRFRDRAWARGPSRQLVRPLLEAASKTGHDLDECVEFLTDFLRSHRPHSPAECREFLEELASAYENDLERHRSGDRSFFDPGLKAQFGPASGARNLSGGGGVEAMHRSRIELARALRDAIG